MGEGRPTTPRTSLAPSFPFRSSAITMGVREVTHEPPAHPMTRPVRRGHPPRGLVAVCLLMLASAWAAGEPPRRTHRRGAAVAGPAGGGPRRRPEPRQVSYPEG